MGRRYAAGGFQGLCPPSPLVAGESAVFQADLAGDEVTLLKAAGRYEIWAEYHSPGRAYEEGHVAGRPPRYQDYWKGSLKSNRCSLEVMHPEGLDRDAYEAFKGDPLAHPDELLSRFPASIYAAWSIYKRSGAEGLAKSDPLLAVGALASGGGSMWNVWVPVSKGGDNRGLAPISGKEAAEWRNEWFGIVLKNHPNIWFADDLRLELAVDQITLKNYQAGAAALETLSKGANTRVAAKAKGLLNLCVQKGWIISGSASAPHGTSLSDSPSVKEKKK